MSNNIIPLKPVVIRDKRLRIKEDRDFAVYEGGEQITYNPFSTTAFSNNYITFNVKTPSPRVVLDRKIYIRYTIQLTFNPVANPSNTKVLVSGHDAFRAFPLTSCMTSINLQINGVGITLNPEDIIHALLRYNTCEKVLDLDYSTAPSMLDKSQDYAQLYNTNRNPLAYYGDNGYQIGRGGFVIKSLVNTNTQAVLVAEITEPLFVSPLNFGAGNSQGFVGVTELDVSINLSNLSRMWSHLTSTNGVVFNEQSIVPQISNPTLLLCYITPKEIFPIPTSVSYSYYFVRDIQTNQGIVVPPNTTANLIMTNTQLASIPRRIFIYAERPRSGTGQKTLLTTDTFFSIESVSITWNNINSVLASATKQDLYQISKKNGCNLSWDEWSGENSPRFNSTPIGQNDTEITLTGSVLCLDMGEDIGLNSLLAPGVGGNYNLQVYVNVKNIHPTDSIAPTLHCVIVSEGAFTILNNTAIPSDAILSKVDVLNVSQMPETDLPPLDAFYGGSFWSKLKDIGSDVLKGFEKALPVIKDIADVGVKVAPLFALGEGGCGNNQANPYMGGKRLPRSKMLKRLTN